jgi:hypothetical protein
VDLTRGVLGKEGMGEDFDESWTVIGFP